MSSSQFRDSGIGNVEDYGQGRLSGRKGASISFVVIFRRIDYECQDRQMHKQTKTVRFHRFVASVVFLKFESF